jgi:small nuclear ribonucleoprotein (snRNP)-like protein
MAKIENKVVVRFRDGKMVKGYTYDFHPHKEVFHVTETQYSKDVTEVSNSLLKAVFFVKTFEGNKDHRGPEDFSLESLKNAPGLKVKVTFSDGEVMYGSTNGYQPDRKGFFIFPADEESNNERVYIIRQSTVTVETLR